MTWGQLRFSLKTSAPGVSLDLIDSFLGARYEQVLNYTNWSGLTRHANIQTAAAYQSSTDTVALAVGNAGVTGTGAAWTSALAGMRFYRPGDAVIYRIDKVLGSTVLILDRPYEGVSGDVAGTPYTGAAYVIMQHIYQLPNDCRSVVEATNPLTGKPLEDFDDDRASTSWGPRTRTGNPLAWKLADDTDDSTPPVLHQIEFFPPPLYARGIPVEYLRSVPLFDGGNTSASPLPWITDSVLLFGCRADIKAEMEDYAGAQRFELKFEGELARLALRDEAERKKPQAMRMASRFTRHRIRRALRGNIFRGLCS
jgi:hypothetical protein